MFTDSNEIKAVDDNVIGGDVWQLNFNQDGTRLGTFQKDSPLNALSFKLWSWPNVKLISTYQFSEKVEGTAFSPDGQGIAYANSKDFKFTIYDVINNKKLNVNEDHGDRILNIGFSS